VVYNFLSLSGLLRSGEQTCRIGQNPPRTLGRMVNPNYRIYLATMTFDDGSRQLLNRTPLCS